jgi:hypothetical protein
MEKLTITIDTNEPIPIDVFNRSLSALSNQFKTVSNETSELYISKLREGSYIIDLVPVAIVAALPLMNDLNTIVQFVEYLKYTKQWLLGISEKPKQTKYSIDDLKEIKELFGPTQFIENKGIMNFYYDSEHEVGFLKEEARTIGNAINRQTIEYSEVVQDIPVFDNYNKVPFYWYQTRFDDKNINKGNKGIIETIDQKPKNVLFADDSSDTKREMTTIHPEINIDWQKIGYIVDVEVLKKENETKAYKILKNYMSDCIID